MTDQPTPLDRKRELERVGSPHPSVADQHQRLRLTCLADKLPVDDRSSACGPIVTRPAVHC